MCVSRELIVVNKYYWTEEEINLLKTHYPTSISTEELLKLLPRRSYSAIKTIAKKLGIKRGKHIPLTKESSSRHWSKKEIEILKENYHKIPDQELLNLLPGRTILGIKHKAKKLNLGFKEMNRGNPWKNKPWTEAEKQILIQYYPILPNEELLDMLHDRTLVAIKTMARKLGVIRDKHTWASKSYGRPWKKDEIAVLKANYGKVPDEQILELLPHRTLEAIHKAVRNYCPKAANRKNSKKNCVLTSSTRE